MKKIIVLSLFLLSLWCGGHAVAESSIETFTAFHEKCIVVDISEQKLLLYEGGSVVKRYPVSTGKNGIGQIQDSGKTPLGMHYIKRKVGDMSPPGMIFTLGGPTGEVWNPDIVNVDDDLVLTRVMMLAGIEEGINKGTNAQGRVVDSFQRYIWIHGTNHEEKIGKPASKGCIRMKKDDIVELYALVAEGSSVLIIAV